MLRSFKTCQLNPNSRYLDLQNRNTAYLSLGSTAIFLKEAIRTVFKKFHVNVLRLQVSAKHFKSNKPHELEGLV